MPTARFARPTTRVCRSGTRAAATTGISVEYSAIPMTCMPAAARTSRAPATTTTAISRVMRVARTGGAAVPAR
ncbi:hypothetical protein MBT84_48195 [Streptomyces sp. MBT84]|nr:hypothetical protein [Streptomyces sp. MBT84]